MSSRDRDTGRKYESGSSKRKRAQKRKDLEEQLRGSLHKYIKIDTVISQSEAEKSEYEDESLYQSPHRTDLVHQPTTSSSLCESYSPLSPLPPPTTEPDSPPLPTTDPNLPPSPTQISLQTLPSPSVANENLNIQNDPGLWPQPMSDVYRTEIVRKGPFRIKVDFFPVDESGRRFSEYHYSKILSNGEKQNRRWMIYSKSKDSVYCFACRLFRFDNANFASSEGVRDWKHIGDYLKSHETGKTHKECMLKWLNMEQGLKNCTTIDSHIQSQIQTERQRWRDILERLLAIVKFLASHNLAFRGHRENLTTDSYESSGNFLDLVKLIARFDPTLRLHLQQVTNNTISDHYLGKNIQNELIQLMASHVKSKIIARLLQNKYFSIILDCTRDISRVEQLSVILRFINKDTADIEEHFVGFLAVEKTTAESLTNCIITELKQLGVPLQNCRGQGYDNGANMRGERSGVQRRLLDINPLAFFVPCGCHSWNLILGDAVSSCVQAQTFFGVLQRLYNLFSGSSMRWAVLKEHVNISLKPLSETRWECRIESVKAVRYQLNNVSDALLDLIEKNTDCQLTSECHSLEKEITTYEFVISLVECYDILFKINLLSKMWQSEKMQLDIAIRHLDAFIDWLNDYRENGFQSALATASEIAEEVGIEKEFKVQRKRRRRRHFDYETEDEAPELSPKEFFQINYFYVVVDTVRGSCQPRFEALKQHQSIFGFLYDIKRLKDINNAELLKHCSDLQIALSIGEKSDIDGFELCEELKMYTRMYDGRGDVASVLKHIISSNLADIYPNVAIALRIIATTPVTVASAERSFSRLKLIKTYLRNSMSQDRLSALALLSIENDVASCLNYSDIIEDFSNKKSRKHF
jgi:hypothetical protein